MENENVLINIKDRPMYREKCSKLVFAMYEKYLGENRKIPKVIEDWKSECINDVLPEVSRVWKTV